MSVLDINDFDTRMFGNCISKALNAFQNGDNWDPVQNGNLALSTQFFSHERTCEITSIIVPRTNEGINWPVCLGVNGNNDNTSCFSGLYGCLCTNGVCW